MQPNARVLESEPFMNFREFRTFNTVVFDRDEGDDRIPFRLLQNEPFLYGDTRVDVFLITSDDRQTYMTIVQRGADAPIIYLSRDHLSLFNTASYAKTHAYAKFYIGDKYYITLMKTMKTLNYEKEWKA